LNYVFLGWVVTAMLCAGGAWEAYHARNAVMRAWPPSIRAYHALSILGLPQ
jgi:hypothetical protein